MENEHNSKIGGFIQEIENKVKEIQDMEIDRNDLIDQNEKNLARKNSWKQKHKAVTQALQDANSKI